MIERVYNFDAFLVKNENVVMVFDQYKISYK